MRGLKPLVLATLCCLLQPLSLALALELRPTQITIQGEQGETAYRTIQVYGGDELGELRPQVMELLFERRARTISTEQIKVNRVATTTIGAQQVATFSVAINLHGVAAGEYTGDLSFLHKGGELKLPLKVTVRHAYLLPLFILLLGVGASVGLSVYRARGRPRDQVLVRVGLVRAYVQRDRTMTQGISPTDPKGLVGPMLQNPFKTRLDAMLLQVEMCLQAERWDEARPKMDQADALLRKWVEGRLGWIDQLAYLGRLEERMRKKAGTGRYLQTVRGMVSDLIANAPAQDSPQTLRDAAQKIADRIEDYEHAESKLIMLEVLRSKLLPKDEQPWILRTTALRSELEGLRPEAETVAALCGTIDKAIEELSFKLEQAVEPEAKAVEAGVLHEAAVEGEPSPPIEPVPEAHLLSIPSLFSNTPAAATSRLSWFLTATYVMVLILLAGAGFNEVYVKKLTFGADAWADYFALLVWGFGSEATRDSVASTLRSFGVPDAGKPGQMS